MPARGASGDEGRATPPNAFDVTTRIVMGATKAQNLGEARERENARKSASKKLQQLRAMSKLGDDEDGDGIDWASEDAVRRMFRLFDDSNDKIVSPDEFQDALTQLEFEDAANAATVSYTHLTLPTILLV